ncbi:hypothetical protein KNP65_03085 [Latilactobacillus curvatus]|uniref:hypothetical protein n=1 Tax=Latilactobacillus curvatus TaxID=28038 RepID=UPI002410FD23|nr:hypothetical protein [Latilactobacillus curvatus]MDG2978922.1 hypothetical protein [Latilactobacillus curvatus]
MRVIDLLQLLADTPKNDGIYFEGPEELQPIAHFELAVVDEQPRLLLQLKAADKKPLKQWEFSLLLNQKNYYQHYMYVQTKTGDYPLFGFRVATDKILLG